MSIVIFLLVLSSLFLPASAQIEKIREAYVDCDSSKAQAKIFYDLVQGNNQSSRNQAYLAAAKMVKAKFGLNPFKKISLFIEGRDELEKLILENSSDIEMRYIRLAIQHTAPIFLSYRDNIDEDKALLIQHLKNSRFDRDFNNHVLKFLTRENLISEKETKEINA